MRFAIWWVLNALYRIIDPRFWITLSEVNWEYDRSLNIALTEHGVSKVEEFTVHVGDVEVWIENYPYASGYLYQSRSKSVNNRPIPGPLTRIRLNKLVQQARTKGLWK